MPACWRLIPSALAVWDYLLPLDFWRILSQVVELRWSFSFSAFRVLPHVSCVPCFWWVAAILLLGCLVVSSGCCIFLLSFQQVDLDILLCGFLCFLLGVHWPWICKLILFISFRKLLGHVLSIFLVLFFPPFLKLQLHLYETVYFCPTNLGWSIFLFFCFCKFGFLLTCLFSGSQFLSLTIFSLLISPSKQLFLSKILFMSRIFICLLKSFYTFEILHPLYACCLPFQVLCVSGGDAGDWTWGLHTEPYSQLSYF